MLKLVLPAALLFAVADTAMAQTTPWASLSLDPMGWNFIDCNDSQCGYYKSATGNGYARIWLRAEWAPQSAAAKDGVLSTVELNEIDCAGGRLRTLQETVYSLHNLGGNSREVAASDWSYVIPGTFGEREVTLACTKP